MNKTDLTVHRGMFKTAKTEVRVLMAKSKADLYITCSKITNPKSSFKVVDTLLHRKSSVLPSHASKQSLADDFTKYFENKIDVIRSGIGSHVETNPDIEDGCPASLCSFTPLSEDEVSKLIVSLSSATCDNDPIPTSLVKECLDAMLPTVTRIVNLSLECGVFPLALKFARVGPLL